MFYKWGPSPINEVRKMITLNSRNIKHENEKGRSIKRRWKEGLKYLGFGYFNKRGPSPFIVGAILVGLLFPVVGMANPEPTVFKSPLVWRTDGEGDYSLPAFSSGGRYELNQGIATDGQVTMMTAAMECKGEVQIALSADNGRTYAPAVNGVPLTEGFTPGNMIKWKVLLNPGSELIEIKIAYTDASGVISSFGEPKLSEFPFRKPLYINNSAEEELYNYQMLVNVGASASAKGCDFDFGGEINPDFTGIRFTAADGETPLPYYREKITGGEKASFWVKIPQIPKKGVMIYAYYGNNDAEDLSSGEATFDFFDDFGGRTPDTEKWKISTEPEGKSSIVSSQLKLDDAKVISKDYKITDGIIEYQANAVVGYETRLIVKADKENSISGEETQLVYSSGYDGAEHCIVVGDIVKENDNKPILFGTEYRYKVTVKGTDISFERYKPGTRETEASVSLGDIDGLKSGYIGLESAKDNVTYYRWIRVRKAADPEPEIDSTRIVGTGKRVNQPVFINTTIAKNGDLVSKDALEEGLYISKDIPSSFTARIMTFNKQPLGKGVEVDISADGGKHYMENCEAEKVYYASKEDFTAGDHGKARVIFKESLSRVMLDKTLKDARLEELSIDYRPGDIFIVTPNGGEKMAIGTRQEIVWTAAQYESDYPMKLEYSIDSGSTYRLISKKVPDTGSFIWAVPANAISDQAKIRISDANNDLISEESNSVFNIAAYLDEEEEEVVEEEAMEEEVVEEEVVEGEVAE